MGLVLPAVRYARSGSVHIAYQVVGDGPVDLVLILGDVTHLEHEWNEPGLAHLLGRLATRCRLIRLDRRGMGLSDRAVGPPTITDRVDDIVAVMDAVGSERASILGLSEAGAAALWMGAELPARVDQLLIYAGSAAAPPDDVWKVTRDAMRDYYRYLAEHWGEPDSIMVPFVAPSMIDDDRFGAWFGELQRLACSPGSYLEMMEASMNLDVRPLLGSITRPTTLLHRVDDTALDIELSRNLARQIPGATLVELPGRDHLPWVGEVDALCDAVEHVVTGSTRPRNRAHATVPPRLRINGVTTREYEVLTLVTQGLSNAAIGRRLHVSIRTVESHCSSLLTKLDLSTRAELISSGSAPR